MSRLLNTVWTERSIAVDDHKSSFSMHALPVAVAAKSIVLPTSHRVFGQENKQYESNENVSQLAAVHQARYHGNDELSSSFEGLHGALHAVESSISEVNEKESPSMRRQIDIRDKQTQDSFYPPISTDFWLRLNSNNSNNTISYSPMRSPSTSTILNSVSTPPKQKSPSQHVYEPPQESLLLSQQSTVKKRPAPQPPQIVGDLHNVSNRFEFNEIQNMESITESGFVYLCSATNSNMLFKLVS